MTVERVPPDGLARWVHTAQPAAALAERIADTEFVPAAMRGKPAVVAACILYGDEIGVGPMQALASIAVVDGRPFPSAELLRALVLREGHTFRVLEATGTRCRVYGNRAGRPDAESITVEWTIEMARAAGLAGRGAWRSYPRALLVARASTDLCRMAFPDVVKGLGHVPDSRDVAEDWQGITDATGLPDTPAPPPSRQLQWTPTPQTTAPGPSAPHAGPGAVPWDEDATKESEAVSGPPIDPAYPAAGTVRPVAADMTDALAKGAEGDARKVDSENVRRIMAAYGDLPYGKDRGTRLSLFSALLDQPVESTKDLERMTAYRLLGSLARLRDGTLIAVPDEHGGFTIHAGIEPEGDPND